MKSLSWWNIGGLSLLLLISCLGWIFARSSFHPRQRSFSPSRAPSKGRKQIPLPLQGDYPNKSWRKQITDYLPLLRNNPFLPKTRGNRLFSSLASDRPSSLPPLDPSRLELKKNVVSSYKNWVYTGYAETEEGLIALLEHQKTKQGRFLSLGDRLEEARIFLLSSSALWLTDKTGKKYILPLNQPGSTLTSPKETAKGEKAKPSVEASPRGNTPSPPSRNMPSPTLIPSPNPSPDQPMGASVPKVNTFEKGQIDLLKAPTKELQKE